MKPDYRFERVQNPAGSPKRTVLILFLILLAVVWGYGAFFYGGVVFPDANVVLLALGILGAAYGLLDRGGEPATGILSWWVYLLPVYAALQLVPLPMAVLKLFSPARAELLRAAAVMAPEARWAPLSVVPTVSMHHFLLLAGYCAVFVMVRRMAARWRPGSARNWDSSSACWSVRRTS